MEFIIRLKINLLRSFEEYGQFFINYLNSNYITLYEYKEGNIKYVSNLPITAIIDLETKLYIRKNRIVEVINNFLDHNLIKKISVK